MYRYTTATTTTVRRFFAHLSDSTKAGEKIGRKEITEQWWEFWSKNSHCTTQSNILFMYSISDRCYKNLTDKKDLRPDGWVEAIGKEQPNL